MDRRAGGTAAGFCPNELTAVAFFYTASAACAAPFAMTKFISLHKPHSGKQLALRNYDGQQGWPFCCLFIRVHRLYMKKQHSFVLLGIVLAASATCLNAATIYDPGVSPPDATSGLTFGTHLISGPHTSVAGVGGSGLSANGSVHNGQRTYIYDKGAGPDLADGIANRGDAGFAMMIWDMGLAYDSLRLYTHQDHYSGGPVTDPFVGQDLMEYSVWGSTDGDNFTLLSDVIAFNLSGGGPGLPTYTFSGTEPSIVYRGGSSEFGIVNAYAREYVFDSAYQYYGIRSSTVSLAANDADPEIDSIAAFNIATRPPNSPGTRPVPDGGATVLLLGLGVGAMCLARRGTRDTSS